MNTTSLVKLVYLDTLKGKYPMEFCSHEIILLVSNILKEPKFPMSECIKVSQFLYKRMKRLSNDCFTCKSLNNPTFLIDT